MLSLFSSGPNGKDPSLTLTPLDLTWLDKRARGVNQADQVQFWGRGQKAKRRLGGGSLEIRTLVCVCECVCGVLRDWTGMEHSGPLEYSHAAL